jgi:coenzyme F420-reducing hydrogenase alpha subunit
MKVEVRHLSRIEGHANLVVDGATGTLAECRLEIVEAPRFFEGLLRGRHCSDVAPIVARICGVCSHSHTLVSLAATEAALGIAVSPQTRGLRRLLAFGEILQSHILHLYFLAAPDYLGVDSIFPLVQQRREVVTRALRMRQLANDICRTVGGRPVHPVTPRLGGFSSLPEPAALMGLRRRLVQVLPDLEATVDLFGGFRVPTFRRPSVSLCLGGEDGYPLQGNRIVSDRGLCHPVSGYREVIEEYAVPHSTAKFARLAGDSYQVGPLARFKNAHACLSPMAERVAAALGLAPDTANPYAAVPARLVEVVHCVEEAIHLIDTLLADGLAPEPMIEPAGGGTGVAAIEAPRGLLFHAYQYDPRGQVVAADCVIPTSQNLANMEADLAALVPTLAGLPREELTRRLEMLLRAYDPCVSCSTHLLHVSFV